MSPNGHRAKLLLHRAEIERLIGEKTAQKGLTLIPTRIYFKGSAGGKVEAGAGRAAREGPRPQAAKIADPRRPARRGRARVQGTDALTAPSGPRT